MNLNVKIDGMDHQGRGIAHYDGKVIFIPNALINEELSIKITETKKNYLVGEVIDYLKESKDRVKPLCPYYEKCGGCSLSHMNYDNQIKYKENKLKNILNKYADINEEINVIESPIEFNYRNKVELKINNYKWGYYNNESHEFIGIQKCLLAKDAINKIVDSEELFNICNGEIIIRCNYNDEIIIKIKTNDKYEIDTNTLCKNNKIVGIIVNDKLIYGENSFIEIVNKLLFKININSFFQINNDILKEVFKVISREKYTNVVDLYCGVGTLGMALKKDKLYGIEILPEAILDAITNAKMNKQNNMYMLGDSSKIKEIDEKIDSLVIDPPRSGLNTKTLDSILDNNIDNIIYMSCDPITLARDLKLMKDKYNIKKIYMFDMFPQTYHIESVCVLNRR